MSGSGEPVGKPVAAWALGLFPENIIGFCSRGLKYIAAAFLSLPVLYVFYSSLSSARRYADCFDFAPVPAGSVAVVADGEALNVSHIVFGIGASVDTWEKRRRYAELWWRPGETRGFVWLDRKPDTWEDDGPPYRVSEDLSNRGFGGSPSAVRMARIAAESFRLGLEGTRWFVMGDDDTVFVPDNVVAALAGLDHRAMWYVGAPSESVEQDLVHSYGMAFGGGGFALSLGAAEALSVAIDGCLERYGNFYGSDQRVQACMSELGVPLTRHPGFHQVPLSLSLSPTSYYRVRQAQVNRGVDGTVNFGHMVPRGSSTCGVPSPCGVQLLVNLEGLQRIEQIAFSTRSPFRGRNDSGIVNCVWHVQVDIHGDAYGLLAAHPTAPLVSLHHLDAVEPLFPTKTQLDSVASLMGAARFDPARTLQQAFCYDPTLRWTVSVSWGYTAQIYPALLPPHVLEKTLGTFQTWRSSQDGPFTFNTRPMPDEPCARPAIFFLDRVQNVSSKATITTYGRHVPGPEMVCKDRNYPSLALQNVRVFSSKMPSSVWTQVRANFIYWNLGAARRQCCDIKWGRLKAAIDVRLRSCGLHETITPPK
ncbi:hypothetical protein EJ110_NYTH21336 [Nymphaea thermarum]|nr:hypothetical protein EJ110_NYTH21336 [Nymphaea thermarum]